MMSVYVTGTDTGVGKTVASVALLHALRARGLRALGMKPVASGCSHDGDGWRNDDARALQQASDPLPAYAAVNPYALPLPTAPEIAAAAAGVTIDLDFLCHGYAELAASGDVVVVEGVGGWAAPLSAALDQSALVHALDLPVVLVVGLRLGCISHARLTARAIVADGCRLLGWIGNHVEPAFAHADDTLAILQREIATPCLGVLSFRRSSATHPGLELNLREMSGLPA
jgi:dethiobiotin synthetase